MNAGLHFRIILGLAFGVVFGIVFPTNSKITESTISQLEKLKLPGEVISILQNEKKEFAETETEFIKRIKPSLGPEYYEKYKAVIVTHSKYNAYLPYISWIGDLFLRALKMIIFPLVLTSVISGLSNITESDSLGRLTVKTILYFVLISSLAIVTGLIFVNIIQPGIGMDISFSQAIQISAQDISFKESLLNIVPDNIFQAFANGNMLSIILFSILFGYFVTKVHDRNRIFLINFFNSVYEVLIKLANYIFRFTPIGIFSLTAAFVADQSGDLVKLTSIIGNLGAFLSTILLGLIFHSTITLPFIMKFGFKISPWKHFRAMSSALITAFSTASTIASLSLTMSSVQRNSGVSTRITSFTLPLGTAVNMDGNALFVSVAALFIAQAYGIYLSYLDQLIVVAISLVVSIGAAGIPMASFASISIILTALGLPLEGIGLILSVDRLLDMFKTSVSVWSHSCAAVIIAKSEGENLKV